MIRPATASDLPAILDLLRAAFQPGEYEAALVRRLLENGRALHHWVALREGEIVGHICYSHAYDGEGRRIGWHLAPLAVRPGWQRRGIGAELARHSLESAELADSAVFVLGDPAYYTRFGFARGTLPDCAFDPAGEHFMARRWAGEAGFTIGYEPEFYLE
jgi:putative acetyltransferase